jgi:hypothetical protein
MLPKITELEFETNQLETSPDIGKSFLFDFEKGDFVLKDGKLIEAHDNESLKVWIKKCLQTEKFRFPIYEDVDYGVTIDDLIGSNFPRAFIESEIKREVTSALTKHSAVQSISGWHFQRDKNWMNVQFQVLTVNGVLNQEVNFIV